MNLIEASRDLNISNALVMEQVRNLLADMPRMTRTGSPLLVSVDSGDVENTVFVRTTIKATIIEDKIYTGNLSDPIL